MAESLILGDISTGASNDIERATEIARKMVTKYGMSEALGPIAFGSGNDEVFLGRDFSHTRNYSENVASEIDEEINRIIVNAITVAVPFWRSIRISCIRLPITCITMKKWMATSSKSS